MEYKIGDCLVLFKDVLNESVDLVLTDPPFGVDYDYESDNFEDKTGLDYFNWTRLWMAEVHRVLKPAGIFCSFSSPKNIREFLNIGYDTGFLYQDLIVWDKKCSQAWNGPRPMPIIELCVFWTKGAKWTFNHVGLTNCLHIMRETPNPLQYHRASRPVALYEILVKALSNEGDLVLDPFVGSGTTLLACKRTGRNCLGFEIDPQYEAVIRSKALMDVSDIENFGEPE